MAVQTIIQHRRDTAANWTSTNPTLSAGEFGFETDTSKFKIGTGSAVWTALAYQGGGGGTQGLTGPQGLTGLQGVTGTQGLDGLQGAVGPQGLTGLQGTDGAQGVQGVQGLGYAQLQGTQGLTGTFDQDQITIGFIFGSL
ncbi:Collagen triple helix repeat [uncultured Caudovirales phage]|uniref:Collagen triple helix repeat n=1 Tax=uncultured Caudovirales phage TaxID=2100421 RepID=A0A6J5Q293_9CAUD|nr:Collagen triple helix repeat [uncultured Caudovirales phage]CAB4179939.1 Collagen triple helix repeat [uncultured Caudovirales phage]CAB4188802.1 Collagen triple helix repeat [uncultured Caudovirales phage]